MEKVSEKHNTHVQPEKSPLFSTSLKYVKQVDSCLGQTTRNVICEVRFDRRAKMCNKDEEGSFKC